MSGASDIPRPSNGQVLRSWVRALELSKQLAADTGTSLARVVAERARTHPHDPALIGETERLTYAELADRAGRYATWCMAHCAPGEVVALLMPNRPEYIAIWLGLTDAGCVVALLDTHLTAAQLAHAIHAAGARRVIAEPALCAGLAAIRDCVPGGIEILVHGELGIEALPRQACAVDMARERRIAAGGKALLIFTSGTTGLPKAAHVRHARVLEWGGWFAGMMDASPSDRLYDCLPLYHSAGGVVAIGAMLVAGGSVVIRKRFSASRFWDDVVASDCTIFQYIGELCRYLLRTSPPASHRLRLACGNGLRGAVWIEMQRRFAIPAVLEFYAATEGKVSLYNREGKPGAIGRIPAFLAHRFPVALVRVDPATGEPVRAADGRCVPCGIDEPGEALGPLRDAGGTFDGYTDPAASERRVLRHVLAADDAWFRTGDLMRRDRAGYFTFVDRLGDTFRWKGENVSTAQVAGVIAGCPGVLDVVVYGVAVPGMEGRAGMAAISADTDFSLDMLTACLRANLPDHARPRFVRHCPAIPRTGTFKLQKANLAARGYAGDAMEEPVWMFDHEHQSFVPCDAQWRGLIENGLARL